jgi:hypothetical protein
MHPVCSRLFVHGPAVIWCQSGRQTQERNSDALLDHSVGVLNAGDVALMLQSSNSWQLRSSTTKKMQIVERGCTP